MKENNAVAIFLTGLTFITLYFIPITTKVLVGDVGGPQFDARKELLGVVLLEREGLELSIAIVASIIVLALVYRIYLFIFSALSKKKKKS